jgi:hypothetical protein
VATNPIGGEKSPQRGVTVVLRDQMAKVMKIGDVVTKVETTRTRQSVIPVIVRIT